MNLVFGIFAFPERLTALLRGDLNAALLRALEDPPYGRHLEEAKVKRKRKKRRYL